MAEALGVLSEPASWRGVFPPEHPAAAVVCHLASRCGLFTALSQLVDCALPVSAQQPASSNQSPSLAERLVTGLTARSLALAPLTTRALTHLLQLLSVPLLWSRCDLHTSLTLVGGGCALVPQAALLLEPCRGDPPRNHATDVHLRCPSLRPLGLRIWHHVVPAVHALGSRSALLAHLGSVAVLGGAGGACACLLGNLAEVSAAGLQVGPALQYPPCACSLRRVMICMVTVVSAPILLDLFCAMAWC